jgi:hypothetical protein
MSFQAEMTGSGQNHDPKVFCNSTAMLLSIACSIACWSILPIDRLRVKQKIQPKSPLSQYKTHSDRKISSRAVR